jgi:MbtH protein
MGFKIAIAVGALVLLAAGWALAANRKSRGPESFDAAWADASRPLFFEVNQEGSDLLLEDWRWLVGKDAKVFHVTVFGDLFTQRADGTVYWLDCGRGLYTRAAKSAGDWAQEARKHGPDWFHWQTLARLRALDIPLKEGDVYSWRQPLSAGGQESVDNVDFVPVLVHVSSAGRFAEAIKDVPPGETVDKVHFTVLGAAPGAASDDDHTVYAVVINAEEQYSMWPASQTIPTGWKKVGKTGTKEECLDYIKTVWTDMRPLSVRKKLSGQNPQRPAAPPGG